MRIALFGGRFDPVHNGHIHVARAVLKAQKADEVWLLPDNQHQWNPIVASAKDRIAMLDFILEDNMQINDTAIQLGGLTEIITVIRTLRQKKPEHDYFFVGGSDLLPSLHKWTHWSELEQELPFLIVARTGYHVGDLPKNCTILEDPNYQPVEDSATRVRTYSREGKSIKELVNPKVFEYIKAHHLYE